MPKSAAYSFKAARVIDIKGNSGREEDIDDKKGSSSTSKKKGKPSKTSKGRSKTSSKGTSSLSRAHRLHRDKSNKRESTAITVGSSSSSSVPDEDDEDEVPRKVVTGKNPKGNCFCQPAWCCCLNRICKVTTTVQIVAWFETLMNLSLMTICLFVVMVWNSHYKHAEKRGFSRKNKEWTEWMEPNEDGFYILGFSYLMMAVVSFWVAMYHTNMSRVIPIGWCIAATYATGLQIVVLVHFPFTGSSVNFLVWGAKAYGFWVMCHYDYLLRNHSRSLKTPSEIELGILIQEGERTF